MRLGLASSLLNMIVTQLGVSCKSGRDQRRVGVVYPKGNNTCISARGWPNQTKRRRRFPTLFLPYMVTVPRVWNTQPSPFASSTRDGRRRGV